MKTYIGIDPGQQGFITVQRPNNDFEFFSIDNHTPQEINGFLKNTKDSSEKVFCVMEEVHSIFGASSKSTFNFGEINGLLIGFLIANGIPYELVQPKKWQEEIWGFNDKVFETKTIKKSDGTFQTRKMVNTKQTSFNSARRIFPNIDLRKSERAKKLDDNKCDSLLICEYARRKNL